MNREWKPGDILTNSAGVWLLYERQGGDVWAISPNGNVPVDMLTHPRPLALIDPENAADVAKLVRLFWAHSTDDGDDTHAMQAALREYANPTPQIDEPTGLGAVVEDIEGVRWTRVESGEAETRNPWYPADCDFQPDEWFNLCAVKVLSEGVTE